MQGKIYGFNWMIMIMNLLNLIIKLKTGVVNFNSMFIHVPPEIFFFLLYLKKKKKMFYIFNTTSYNLMNFNNFSMS